MKFLYRCVFLCILCLLPAAVSAADHPYQGWRQIQTEQVQIIFEPQDIAYAEHLAGFADDVIEQLARDLGFEPHSPIPVVLAGRTASANGFYSPFPHSITLFITAPSNRFLGARTKDWLYTLFVHEATHYLHLTAREGPAKLLAPVFGPDITAMNTIVMPGWWLEGITTYAETAFSPGGRGEAPLFQLTYTAPILEGNMWSLSQGGYQSAYPPRGRIYSAGYIFTDYLTDRFGQDVFQRINSQYLGFPFFGISYAIQKVTGYDAETLYQDMIDSILEEARHNTRERTGEAFSPFEYGDYHLPVPTDEGWIGYARTLDEGSSILQYGDAGVTTKKIFGLSPSDNWSVSPSPDGRQAVAASLWTDYSHPAAVINTPVTFSDLHIIDLADGTSRQLTEGKRLYQPVWSPDGSLLAAVERAGTRFRLVLVDPADGGITPLYTPSGNGSVYQPSFSPQGDAAVAVEVKNGASTLIAADLNGEIRSLWPHADEELFYPRFTPEGNVLFASDRSGFLRLYETDVETGDTWQLLDDPAGVVGADVRDGQLVYGTYTSQGFSLYHTPYTQLNRKQVPHPEAAVPSGLPLHTDSAEYDVQKYRDIPRPGLWFPLFIHQDAVAPGIWTFAQSVLARHAVQASAGWSLRDDLPLLQAAYTFSPGWGTVMLRGSHNTLDRSQNERYDSLSTSLTLPLWYKSPLSSLQMLSGALQAELQFRDSGSSLQLVGQAGYQQIKSSPPAAFYGGSAASASAGVQTKLYSNRSDTDIIPFASASGQLKLPWAHHVLRAEVQGITANSVFWMDGPLPPRGGPEWGPELLTRAKIQPSVLYRIPLGLFDQPLPFGAGITAAGATLFAQSAWYHTGTGFTWEDELYAGIEGAVDISAGGLAVLRPAAGVTVDVRTGNIKPYISIDIQSYFRMTSTEVSVSGSLMPQKTAGWFREVKPAGRR